MSTSPAGNRPIGLPPAQPKAHTQAQGQATRGERSAFERALGRVARSPLDQHAASEKAGVEQPGPRRVQNRCDAAADADCADSAADALDGFGVAGQPEAQAWREADHGLARSAETAGGGRDSADGERKRRWLHDILDALDAAGLALPANAHSARGMAVSALVPGIGAVRLDLTWAQGAVQVRLRPLADRRLDACELAGNAHVESLRSALGRRTPPVALLTLGSDEPDRSGLNAGAI
jgi:hypothetical protein